MSRQERFKAVYVNEDGSIEIERMVGELDGQTFLHEKDGETLWVFESELAATPEAAVSMAAEKLRKEIAELETKRLGLKYLEEALADASKTRIV